MARVACVEHNEEPVVGQFVGTCACLDDFPERFLAEASVVEPAVPAIDNSLTMGTMAETIEGHTSRICRIEDECTALATLEPDYTVKTYRNEPRDCGHNTGKSWGGEFVITPRAEALIQTAMSERKLINERIVAATHAHRARYSQLHRLFANGEAKRTHEITVAPWLHLSHRLKQVIKKAERIMNSKQVADGSDHGRCPGCKQRDRFGP
jgi:hypothetical protein